MRFCIAVCIVLTFEFISCLGVYAQGGQAPQPGLAVFDIEVTRVIGGVPVVTRGMTAAGLPVSSNAAGPYSVFAATPVPPNAQIKFEWGGVINSPVILMSGPSNTGIATYPGVGQLDIGLLPLTAQGIPSSIVILGDGTNTPTVGGPPLNSFFFVGAAGVGSLTVNWPVFSTGSLMAIRFQCLMNPPGVFHLSNAVDLII